MSPALPLARRHEVQGSEESGFARDNAAGPLGGQGAPATVGVHILCQLLGMNANTPTDAMFSFTGLATRADEHKDGFGIAFFEDRGLRLFVDQHSARHSPVAELVKGYPIRSDNVIAHIRKA